MATATRPPRLPWLPLGTLLVREGLITAEQLELALMEQQQLQMRLGEILVHFGWVSSRSIAMALAEQYEFDFVDVAEADIDETAVELLDEELAYRYQALPVTFLPDDLLLVAIADPTDVGMCDELRRELGPIRLAVADKTDLDAALARAHSGAAAGN